MRYEKLGLLVLLLSGCSAPPGRWQVVPVSFITGFDKGSSILLDTQTGQTWVQDFVLFPTPGDRHFNALYWRPLTKERPTTLPDIEKQYEPGR